MKRLSGWFRFVPLNSACPMSEKTLSAIALQRLCKRDCTHANPIASQNMPDPLPVIRILLSDGLIG
jgi:hypothetical protein